MTELNYTSETTYEMTRAHATDAGIDLIANDNVTINPATRTVIGTGMRVAIPDGYYGQIAPRSGLAVKHSIDVKAGVIDSGYRGELMVCLKNDGRMKYDVLKGDRIAQLIIIPCSNAVPVKVESLDNNTERATGGFGSSGY